SSSTTWPAIKGSRGSSVATNMPPTLRLATRRAVPWMRQTTPSTKKRSLPFMAEGARPGLSSLPGEVRFHPGAHVLLHLGLAGRAEALPAVRPLHARRGQHVDGRPE